MKKESGQSLIEVVLALGVAIVVIVALIQVAVVSMRNARFAKDEAQATVYAQQSLEEARRLRDELGSVFFINPLQYCDTSPETIGTFTRDRNCSINGGQMTVSVTVQWEEGGETKEVKVETVLTNWQ